MTSVSYSEPGNSPTGNIYVDSLIWGTSWDLSAPGGGGAHVLTYSFDAFSLGYDFLDYEIAAFEAVLQTLETYIPVDFVEVQAADSNFVFVLTDSDFLGAGVLGMNDVPGEEPVYFDAGPETVFGYFNIAYFSEPTLGLGGEAFHTVLHEILHGLGLSHPHDNGGGSSIFPGVLHPFHYGRDQLNQQIYTVMSYNYTYGETAPWGGDEGWAFTPMAFDIAALQAIYGQTVVATGDDTYHLGQVSQGWMSIWDSGGIDTLSNAGSSRDAVLDLNDAPLTGANAGGFVSTRAGAFGGYTIASGALIENAIGGSGDDMIFGNALDNVLDGGGGDDELHGGAGNDTLIGGAGADTFYVSNEDGHDVIADFSLAQDRIVFVDRLTGAELDASAVELGYDELGQRVYTLGPGTSVTLLGIVNAAPEGNVAILGDRLVGATLSLDLAGLSDADGIDAGTLRYQWLRDGEVIDGATAASLVLGRDDLGSQISVVVSYTDGFGAAESVTSAPTTPISAVNSQPTGAIVITGLAEVGSVLEVDLADVRDADGIDAGTFGYQWLRDGEVIDGATGASLTLTEADIGAEISVRISYTDGLGTPETLTSAATDPVAAGNRPPEGGIALSGAGLVGLALAADLTGLDDPDGIAPDTITLQWLRDGVEIAGATGDTYVPSLDDSGAVIGLRVDFIDGLGKAESVTANLDLAIAAARTTGGEVLSAVTQVLAEGAEAVNLTLLGEADINGTGNGAVNMITGNAGANRLSGKAGNDKLLGGAGEDTLKGGSGADRLVGGAGGDKLVGGWGNDSLRGNGGDDVLIGNAGKDTLIGGGGADRFVFTRIADSAATTGQADVIRDFTPGQDLIDLRRIDASSLIDGNNAFRFIGEAQITTSPLGEISIEYLDRAGTKRDETLIWIDTDADREAEMVLRLRGLIDLDADDFLL